MQIILLDSSWFKGYLFQLDGKSKTELAELLREYKIKSPTTGNDLSDPIDYNLMFSTQIGPSTAMKGFVIIEIILKYFVSNISNTSIQIPSPRNVSGDFREFQTAFGVQ